MPFELSKALLTKSFESGWSINSFCGGSHPPRRVINSFMSKSSGVVYSKPNVTKRHCFPDCKFEGWKLLEGAHAEVRVQAIAPADFPKAFEAFKRLPSGQLDNVDVHL